MKTRLTKRPTPLVREWARYISLTMKKQRATVVADEVVRLAGFLSLMGPVQECVEEFHALASLFLVPERAHGWNAAVNSVPFTKESVERIARAALAYNRAAPATLSRARVQLDRVLPVMAQVRAPDLLVRDAMAANYVHPHAVFHPNVYEYAKQRYRGQLSELADTTVQSAILGKVTSLESE